jgi:predicted permease
VLAHLFADLRFGLRVLAAKPGFALAAILTLALGIGANTLVFTLIDGVYLSTLPYRDAEALVDVYSSAVQYGGGVDAVSIPDYVDLRAGVAAFADSALYTDVSFNLVDGGTPERLQGLRATPSLFSTLGSTAALGRVFSAEEGTPGHEHVVVLSDALWRNRFNADAQILGRDLRLDGENYRVVGVMAPTFMFPRVDAGVFVPFAFAPQQLTEDQRGVNYSAIVARLAPGATLAQVDAQTSAVIQRNLERISRSADNDGFYASLVGSGFRFGARPLREQLSGSNAGELIVLQIAVALVLLIVLANVGNLMLTRLTARHAELAVRTALGARRADVARQLLTEAMLLALAGGMLGLVLAWLGVKVVVNSGLLPAWATFLIDYRTLMFTLAIAIVASLAFGLAPALLSFRAQPQTVLRESGRLGGGGQGARRMRATLVVVQIALAIALLAGAGLLLRSFANASAQSPGFSSANVLTAHLTLPAAKYPDAAAQARGVRRILDATRTLPGADAVGLTTKLPFSGENSGIVFRIAGSNDESSLPHAAWRSVDEDFFGVMSIPLLQGRVFKAADWETQAKTIVVDASFQRQYFPRGDAVGQHITLGSGVGGDAYEIIGVVGSVKHWDLTSIADKPTFYFNFGTHAGDGVYLALRTADASSAFVEALRTAVRSVDAEQPLFNISTLDQRIRSSLTGRRVPLQLLALFAGCALLLAAIGIYGVLAFGVEQRTAEIGLRMAIGADANRVRRGVLADGARLIGAGVGAGTIAAIGIGFLLENRLFDVAPIDPLSLAGVATVLIVTALAACWFPANRAARLDPLVALRHE